MEHSFDGNGAASAEQVGGVGVRPALQPRRLVASRMADHSPSGCFLGGQSVPQAPACGTAQPLPSPFSTVAALHACSTSSHALPPCCPCCLLRRRWPTWRLSWRAGSETWPWPSSSCPARSSGCGRRSRRRQRRCGGTARARRRPQRSGGSWRSRSACCRRPPPPPRWAAAPQAQQALRPPRPGTCRWRRAASGLGPWPLPSLPAQLSPVRTSKAAASPCSIACAGPTPPPSKPTPAPAGR